MQTGITAMWQKGIKDLGIRVNKEENKIAVWQNGFFRFCLASWKLLL